MKNLSIFIFAGLLQTIVLSCFLFGNEKPITFVIFGDCHINDTDNLDSTVLKKIIQKINQKNPEVQFAVNLGDTISVQKNVNFYERAIENYMKLIKNLKIPVYHVPGNHDLMDDKNIQEIYKNKIGPLYYEIEKNSILLIFLNSESLDEAQIKWLKEKIKKPFKTKLIFVHRPVFPVYSIYEIRDIKKKVLLTKILEENNTTAIFSGHEHFFYIKKHNSILQVISGGAGAKLLPSPQGGISIFHYCVVYIKDSQVTVNIVPVDDNEIK